MSTPMVSTQTWQCPQAADFSQAGVPYTINLDMATQWQPEQLPCSVLMVPVPANCFPAIHGDNGMIAVYPATSTAIDCRDTAYVETGVNCAYQVPRLALSEMNSCNTDSVAKQQPYLMPSTEDFTTLCTPEVTPRRAPDFAMELDTTQFERVLASTFALDESADSFAELFEDMDDKDDVCWDFDINAALLIRAQRDGTEYASSDTSTAVSRSSRHRRGRRVAKTKAKSSSMAILEAPPKDDLIVTEQKKIELIKQMETGGDQLRMAVSSLIGNVLRMSLEPFGCRVVQTALELASIAEKELLAAELLGHVRLLVSSPHGNFVIQKVIEVFPVHSASFVAEELATVAVDVAQHRFGCRVFSRLIEHHLGGNVAYPAASKLVDELLSQVDLLIRHNFARHVVELILEHGNEGHKERIAAGIRNNAFNYAKNRCASYIIEKALMFCSDEDKEAISNELLADTEKFLQLAVHECGMHPLKAVVKSRTQYAQRAKALLLANGDYVKASKFGKRLLEDIM